MPRSAPIVLLLSVAALGCASSASRASSHTTLPTPTNVASAASTQAATPRVDPPTKDYLVYTVSESADQVALVRFGPKGISVERSHKVGMMPTEINGPHGIAVSPDRKYYY